MPVSLTETLDYLYTTTWQNMKSKISDNIFDATAFWFWLKAHGGLERTEGGRWIGEPLRYAKSDNVKFIQKGGTVDLSETEFLTTAKYDWRYLVDSMVRFGVDDQQNRGKNQIISLMRAKLDNSKDSLADKMEIELFGQASDDGGIGFHGLKDLVPVDPTSGTVGGLDASVYTWWRSKTRTMTTVSMASNITSYMSNMLNTCSNNIGQDRPNIIVCAQEQWEAYEDVTMGIKRIQNKMLGDAGFQTIEYQGIPLIWSGQALADAMYFLNTRFLKFRYDPQMFFDMTAWKDIPNQVNDRAAQIITAGNLVTSRRRVHGIIHSMDQA